jgi:hypothetical protein
MVGAILGFGAVNMVPVPKNGHATTGVIPLQVATFEKFTEN